MVASIAQLAFDLTLRRGRAVPRVQTEDSTRRTSPDERDTTPKRATKPERSLTPAAGLVLERLEAWLAGDQQEVARIDAAAPKDPHALAAMFAAAFGFAERSLNVIRYLDEDELQITLASFREQLSELDGD